MLTCDFCFHSILIQADNIPVVLFYIQNVCVVCESYLQVFPCAHLFILPNYKEYVKVILKP